VIGVVAGLGLLASTALALRALTRDDTALAVDGWSLSRSELSQHLEDLSSNVLYTQALEQQGRPLEATVAGTDVWAPSFVAATLNDRIEFQLAEQVVRARGGDITDGDRSAASVVLAEQLIGTGQLAGIPGDDDAARWATLEIVLSQFGDSRVVLEDGVAWLVALQRLVRLELGSDATQEDVTDQMTAILDEAKAAARIEVDADLGRWDPDALVVVAVDVSTVGLVPVGPGTEGGTVPSNPAEPPVVEPPVTESDAP